MPVNTAQLLAGANTQLESYATGDPADQINADRPFLKWLVANRVETIFGNGIFNEKVRISNDSNYQAYSHDDQVTYNRKDTVRKAPFQHYEAHDGFSISETELANNGIIMTDDRNAVISDAERIQIVNLLRENHETLKLGMQENFDLAAHLDGSASAKDIVGLDLIVSTTPAVGTIGGVDASTAAYWRNNTNLGIVTTTPGDLVVAMEATWRDCGTYGGTFPDFLLCGSKFYDAYRADSLDTINRQLSISGRGGSNVDAGTSGVFFKGVPLVWDPTLDALEAAVGPSTYPYDKRCYFLNKKHFKLRPFKGRWMVQRKPSRMYDRYTHFFATTLDAGMTTDKRNSLAVLSIA